MSGDAHVRCSKSLLHICMHIEEKSCRVQKATTIACLQSVLQSSVLGMLTSSMDGPQRGKDKRNNQMKVLRNIKPGEI